MRLGIRCDGDAGQESGTGHVFRSLEYAKLLLERHPELEVRFFMRSFSEGVSMVHEAGYDVKVLPLRPTEKDYNAVFSPFEPDLIILDTLGTDMAVMNAAREAARRVITLDDLTPVARRADAIINGILWASERRMDDFGGVSIHQGVKFMPLRTQFANASQRRGPVSESIKEIMVCTGGHDETMFAPQIFASLKDLFFDCKVTFYAGPSHERISYLKRLARELSLTRVAFEVRQNVKDMAACMLHADLALLTGGTLLFEAAACGLPAIIVCSQQHQEPQATWFHKQGAVVSLGYMNKIDGHKLRNVVQNMDTATRQLLSEKGAGIVDGRGMERVVDILSRYLTQ